MSQIPWLANILANGRDPLGRRQKSDNGLGASLIRMVVGSWEFVVRGKFVVAGARHVPNALIVPFRIELRRPAA